MLGLFLLLILKKHCTQTVSVHHPPKKLLLLTATEIHLTSQLLTLHSLPKGGEVPLLLLFVYYGTLIIWDAGSSPCTSVHMGTSTELPAELKTLLFVH